MVGGAIDRRWRGVRASGKSCGSGAGHAEAVGGLARRGHGRLCSTESRAECIVSREALSAADLAPPTPENLMALGPDDFRSALGRFASGVTILTVRDRDGRDHGMRSEERRVGKECRSRWAPYH